MATLRGEQHKIGVKAKAVALIKYDKDADFWIFANMGPLFRDAS